MARPLIFVSAMLVLASSNVAHANPEPTTHYDGRAAGMAGLAVAYTDNSAAIFHNPAGLGNIRRFSFSLVMPILYVRYNVPFAGPGSEQSSPPIVAPTPFFGVAGRISRRLTVGGAIYVPTGFGGSFTNIHRLDDYTPRTPCANAPAGADCSGTPNVQTVSNQSVKLFVLEAAASLGVNVLDNLRLGLSIRLPFAYQSVSSMQEAQANNWQNIEQTVQGFGLPAVLLGAQWDVNRHLSLGAVYRSPTAINMSGTTLLTLQDGQPVQNVDSSATWKTPNMFRIGAAIYALDRRLMINMEFRAQFHASSNKSETFNLCLAAGGSSAGPCTPDTNFLASIGLDKLTAPFEWYNVYYPTVGAEYRFRHNMWWRFGTSVGKAATPPRTASQFAPPPGWQYNLATGFGVQTGRWRLDFAYAFAVGAVAQITQRNSVNCGPNDAQKSGCDGNYQIDTHTFSLSATYTR